MNYSKNKKIALSISAIFIILAGVLTSCKKENVTVDKEAMKVSAAQFLPHSGNHRVTYYIGSNGASFKIPVSMTDVSNVDRTLQFTYSSRTAIAGTQYNAPSSVVIKAGSSIDTLAVQGLFAGYPSANRVDTLKIKFTTSVKAIVLKDSVEVIMRKYCEPVLSSLQGLYARTNEYSSAGAFSYGPYNTALKNASSSGTNMATALLENLYDDGWSDINCTLDWTNPANFKVTIPLQPTGSPNRSVRTSVASGAVSTFSACDNTITLDIDILNTSTGAVLSSKYRIVMAR